MKDGSVLGEATAVAAVSFDRLRPLLTADGAAVLLGVDAHSPGVTVGADPGRSMVWLHGEYWYQGEYSFAAHPDGTEVTYRIRNVSGHPDLAIRLWQRRTLKAQQRDLNDYVSALPARVA